MTDQWQTYKTLELIPASVPDPRFSPLWATALQPAWRSLLNRLAQETSIPQQVQHLEQCWFLNFNFQASAAGGTARSNLGASLSLLWRSLTRDPEIEGTNPYLYARAWDWMVDGQPAVKKQPSSQAN